MITAVLVVTTINPPNKILKQLNREARSNRVRFIIVGDKKTPTDFQLDGCEYISPTDQKKLNFITAETLPWNHYSRKNLGYLLAIKQSTNCIIETDDDNFPISRDFWQIPTAETTGELILDSDWTNVFKLFYGSHIWPRGFPLKHVQDDVLHKTEVKHVYSPIWQGLANGNPDVDAIYRLTCPLPQNTIRTEPLFLGKASWCPFNSQNTKWLEPAFPLLYLPSTCSFRMTDIWRSFIAQAIAYRYGWSIAYETATVEQKRNDHDLLKDFKDEVSGYLCGTTIIDLLKDSNLSNDPNRIYEDLRIAYELLIRHNFFKAEEIKFLDAWIKDITSITNVA